MYESNCRCTWTNRLSMFVAVMMASWVLLGCAVERLPDVRQPSPSEITLTLTADRHRYGVGETPSFSVRIHNHSDGPVLLVRSLDGSGSGMRYPHFIVERHGPVEPPRLLRCDNTDNLHSDDFVVVQPGEGFNPFGKGFSHHYLLHDQKWTQPGTYTYRITYDTTSDDIAKWYGFGSPDPPSRTLKRLLRRVPKLKITSNEVVVEVVAEGDMP